MSVCIVRCDRLCSVCASFAHVIESTEEYVVGAVEVNDLCTSCMQSKHRAYIRYVNYDSEQKVVGMVLKKSPWHRSIRRHEFWNSWKGHTSVIALITLVCLLFWLIATEVAFVISELPWTLF